MVKIGLERNLLMGIESIEMFFVQCICKMLATFLIPQNYYEFCFYIIVYERPRGVTWT